METREAKRDACAGLFYITDKIHASMTEGRPISPGNALKFFGLVMAIVYLAAGILLLLPGIQITFLSGNSRLVLGIALVIYGLFRAWRSFKSIKDENP